MQRRLRRRVNSANSLIAVCTIAVLIPTLILSGLQYRSLQQLRSHARIAVDDQVRQTIEMLRQNLESSFREIGRDSLKRFDASDLLPSRLEATGAKFLAISRQHSEIRSVFAVSNCSCRGEPFAILSSPDGAGWIKCSRFGEPAVAGVLSAFRGATSGPGADSSLIYFQSRDQREQPLVYVFRFLDESARSKSEASFAGIALDAESLLRTAAAQALAAWKQRGQASAGELDITIEETGRGIVYSTSRAARSNRVAIHAGPIFPLWNLTGRYNETAIEALAGNQFRNGLFLSGGAVLSLVLAIVLSLRAMAREAKLAEVKSAFASNVSHEMKTPLALIRLFSETLELGRINDPVKLQEYYRVINRESRKLTQLIEKVLDLARMEAGRKPYQLVTGDIAGVVEDVLKSYEEPIVDAGFELHVDIQRPIAPVRMDADAVAQAILNLIDNALKYSDGRKQIDVRVSERGDEIRIEVADQGVGIPESERERIFEKFYRSGAGLVHDTKGSGLGLTLTRHIVEAHGGRIELVSAVGKGSRFTIALPVASPAPDQRSIRVGETVAQSAHR